ncbi:UvrD-helicase domain-containing protein [Streptomyces poriferorum]|uniref:DNA 3'-5' helicase n=1 Tax=Streptomyces poriferorum TaxID=2798799 RepID=A0ABY9IJZ4_9ACTN|nr:MULTISPECIES: UvrD-helicase domain-containing protein [unclassified Streptomyces]MDP5315543.1 AAA family ATPase [Streptomyces sp. Alt4]WLQ55608.1 AAA family ATPase [Streptomyces sp. Alt2]
MSQGVRTQVTVTPQANEDIRRLDAATKNAVGDFVRRLRTDRSNRALRLVFLRETGGNGRLFLASLDGSRMGLLLETEENRFSLLAVRVGPAARDELARLTVEINAVSGGVELVDQSEVSAQVVAMPARPEPDPAPDAVPAEAPAAEEAASPSEPVPTALPVPLFARYDDGELVELGVIASLLPALRRITDGRQLEAVLGHNLPGLTREVLLALHDGMEPSDVRALVTDQWRADGRVDPQDWAQAARRPVSQVSTEDAAVLDALGDGFEAWRLFLHPEQRRLATTSFKGSAKVTGGPGTGKTVVALHRVRYLVDRLPPGQTRPVLLTTYNTNLAADLRERLHRLGGDALVRRVDVKSVDQVAREVVEQHPGSVLGTPMGDEEAMALWHRACTEVGVFDYDADFLDAEFKHVILAQGCGTERLYFRAERKGRGVLQRADRKKVWELVQTYRSLLDGPPRRTTYALIADEAARIEGRHMAKAVEQARYKEEHGGLDLVHREAGSGMWLKPRYRHVVVDEAQDLSASHWRMLRAMTTPGPDDIFLVGDAHQRIYSHQVVLGRLGINTPGRASRRLTLNYRTTREILGSAHGLVHGESFDDLDDGADTLDGYRSVLTGLAPQYWRAPDWETEMRAIAALLKERHERYGTPYAAMAVSVPDKDAVTQLAYTLACKPFLIPASEIGREGPRDVDTVHIGTMHRFKGLEFQRVFLAGVSEGLIPHQRIETFRLSSPDRYRQEEQRARSLLFVAATRARDELIVTWHGRASRYLPRQADRDAGRASSLLREDGPPSGSNAA